MHISIARPHAQKRTLSLGAMTVFSFIAATLLAASSGAPTPIYRLYQEAMHLTPVMVTVVFAIYAFSLLAALLTVGGLSDYLGRKPVIFASLILNVGAMVLFATAGDFGQLIFARVVQGLSVGTGITVLGAAILDTNRTHGPLLNSVFIFIGLMVGSLGSAVLVTFAPDPLHLVYGVLLVLTAVLIALLWAMPETSLGKPGAWSSLRPHVSVPRQSRAMLLRLSPGNVASWAFGSFYLSLMPAIVATDMGVASPLIGGIVVAALVATAAMTVAVLKGQPPRRLVVVGTAVLSLGVALSLLGIEQRAVGALLAGTVVAGIGFGANFSGTLRALLPTAHPDQRAGLLSAFYVECYLAFSLPTIAAGLAVPQIGLSTTAYVYGIAVILLALASMIASLFDNENERKPRSRA
jgi:MFS family permease